MLLTSNNDIQGGPQARLEEAVEDVGQGKVGPQLLVGELVARLAQPLRPERNVPVPQLALAALPRAVQNSLSGHC